MLSVTLFAGSIEEDCCLVGVFPKKKKKEKEKTTTKKHMLAFSKQVEVLY